MCIITWLSCVVLLVPQLKSWCWRCYRLWCLTQRLWKRASSKVSKIAITTTGIFAESWFWQLWLQQTILICQYWLHPAAKSVDFVQAQSFGNYILPKCIVTQPLYEKWDRDRVISFSTVALMSFPLLLCRCPDIPARPVLQLAKPDCPGGDGCPVCQDDHRQAGGSKGQDRPHEVPACHLHGRHEGQPRGQRPHVWEYVRLASCISVLTG